MISQTAYAIGAAFIVAPLCLAFALAFLTDNN